LNAIKKIKGLTGYSESNGDEILANPENRVQDNKALLEKAIQQNK
jgi:hypothetical protein